MGSARTPTDTQKDFLVARSLAVDKGQISLPGLMNALFYDLGTTEKDLKIPTTPKWREWVLRELIKRRQKSVALFIDDAHDLQTKTLVGLKRLIEVVRDGGGDLSAVLAGHPKLRNDLRRPAMEKLGLRTAVFELESFTLAEELAYLKWLSTVFRPRHASSVSYSGHSQPAYRLVLDWTRDSPGVCLACYRSALRLNSSWQ